MKRRLFGICVPLFLLSACGAEPPPVEMRFDGLSSRVGPSSPQGDLELTVINHSPDTVVLSMPDVDMIYDGTTRGPDAVSGRVETIYHPAYRGPLHLVSGKEIVVGYHSGGNVPGWTLGSNSRGGDRLCHYAADYTWRNTHSSEVFGARVRSKQIRFGDF